MSLARGQALVGRELDVLIEERHGQDPAGRSYRDAPEIDGSVVLRGAAAAPGDFVRARIVEARPYDLIAVPV